MKAEAHLGPCWAGTGWGRPEGPQRRCFRCSPCHHCRRCCHWSGGEEVEGEGEEVRQQPETSCHYLPHSPSLSRNGSAGHYGNALVVNTLGSLSLRASAAPRSRLRATREQNSHWCALLACSRLSTRLVSQLASAAGVCDLLTHLCVLGLWLSEAVRAGLCWLPRRAGLVM